MVTSIVLAMLVRQIYPNLPFGKDQIIIIKAMHQISLSSLEPILDCKADPILHSLKAQHIVNTRTIRVSLNVRLLVK